MKKLAILTSILALAACGGGGNGGIAPVPSALTPEQSAARLSNKNTTSIAYDNRAEIIKFANDYLAAHPEFASLRSATTRGASVHSETPAITGDSDADLQYALKVTEGVPDAPAFEIFDINKVEFTGSQENPYHNNKNWFMYTVEEGTNEIIGMEYKKFDGDETSIEATLTRVGDGNTYELDGLSMEVVKHGEYVGLDYADFGLIKPNTGETDTEVFAGVLPEREIKAKDIVSDDIITFSGKAVGAVMAFDGEGSDKSNIHVLELEPESDENVMLDFTPGENPSATLNAFFANWYDIEVTGLSVNELNENYVEGGTPNPTQVKFTYYPNSTAETFEYNYTPDEEGRMISDDPDAASSFIQYAGNGEPTEAVGWVRHTDAGKETETLDMHISFGAKAQ